jgi:hypothetical protein
MRNQFFIKVVVGFLALLLFSKAGMATAVYSDKNPSEKACFIQSSGYLEQKGIIEPLLQLQSPASSTRILKFIESDLKSPEGSSFAQKKYSINFFLNYHHSNLYKGISIYLFNCVFII